MQRIDENTYIDDTLVTCAEYQLFIDEMRAQGKYYQPDHWTSYQFSPGQAKEPVSGVRRSDAVAFCEWLTSSGRNEWTYRLPVRREATSYPPKTTYKAPLGCWTIDIDNRVDFAWVSSLTDNVRNIDRSRAHQALAHSGDVVLNRALDVAIDSSCSLYLDLDNLLTQLANTPNTSSSAYFNTHMGNIITALDRNAPQTRDFFRARVSAVALQMSISIKVFVDILTLQERIAGRSPAFEGIRLVKERIR